MTRVYRFPPATERELRRLRRLEAATLAYNEALAGTKDEAKAVEALGKCVEETRAHRRTGREVDQDQGTCPTCGGATICAVRDDRVCGLPDGHEREAIAAARAEGAAEEREACAALHEIISPNCDHDPGAGAGAMGAIIRYRDAIRARR